MAVTNKTVGTVGGLIAAAISIATPFIMQNEGRSLVAKPDVGATLAICYGHDGVARGTKITPAQCTRLLQQDEETYTVAILKVTPDLVNHTNQLAATIDFSYNVGVGAYAQGSVARDFKVGNYKAGCKAMLLYNKVKGVVNQGLVNRRKADYTLCMKGL